MIHRCGQTGPPSVAGPVVAPLPQRQWHGPQPQHAYVIASAVRGAQTKPQGGGKMGAVIFWCCLYRMCRIIAIHEESCVCVCVWVEVLVVHSPHIPRVFLVICCQTSG